MNIRFISAFSILIVISCLTSLCHAQTLRNDPSLDEKVKRFLESHEGQWHDLNIPEQDGQTLFDLIIKHHYKNALEIGTSTGHSGIWIAWALSKTGGKLITIEIDEGRHKTALENFRKAGLSEYIDARLADAHGLVKELKGPFDFVFNDADKDWYTKYFIDIDPKLSTGGCYTAHNVYGSGRWNGSGQATFLKYISIKSNYETTLNNSGGGLLISYKRASK